MRLAVFFLVPLLVFALSLSTAGAQEDADTQWKHLNDQVGQAFQQGRYEEGIAVAKQALKIAKNNFAEEHPNTAVSYAWLAHLYNATGRYAEAEPLFKKALEICRKALGEEHPDTAMSYNNLAALYQSTGRYAEAEPLMQKALEIERKTLGEEHPDTARSYNNLAALYQSIGRYAEAEPLVQKALEIWRKSLGEEHPDTATSYNNLSALYQSTGRYAEAESLMQKALEIRRKALGEEHPNTASSWNNLASLYQSTGRYDEAEPLYKKALEIRRKALGEEHPDTATSYGNLAGLYKATGRYAEAEPLYKKALEIYRKALGEEHPNTATSYHNLAELYRTTGRYSKAEPLYKKALDIYRKALGDEHPYTATSYVNLGTMYWALDRNEEAGKPLDASFSTISSFLVRNLNAGQTGEGMKLLETNVSHIEVLTSFNLSHRSAKDAYDMVAFYKGLFFDAASAARQAGLKDPKSRERFDQFAKANERLTFLINKRMTTEPHARAKLDEEIKGLQARVSELDIALANVSAAYRTNRDALSADEKTVRVSLPTGAAFVDYFRYQRYDPKDTEKQWHEHRYAAFVVTRDKVEYVDLGEADVIDELVEKLRVHFDPLAVMSGGAYAEKEVQYRDAAKALYDKVFTPCRAHLAGYSQVIVSPDGALSTIPFSVLVDDQGRYLIESFTFGYAASAREIIRATAGSGKGEGSLLVGDPDFDFGAQGTVKVASAKVAFTKGGGFSDAQSSEPMDVGTLRFGRLEETAEEVKRIAKATGEGTRMLLGPAATEAAVKQGSPGRRTLYYSTHGYFINRPEKTHEGTRGGGFSASIVSSVGGAAHSAGTVVNPLSLCGLAFAGANIFQGIHETGDDGLLTGAEVVNLDLAGVRLVVLSACVTGLGEVKSGQGVMGLRYAFTLAGARTVAATSWSVPSNETKDLMEAWMPRMLADENPAKSLRDEQLKLMAQVQKRTGSTHPYFWGAFTVSGRSW
jgi:tetratricopeptide (TPR) repeat protein/CHAT domain-containing protein